MPSTRKRSESRAGASSSSSSSPVRVFGDTASDATPPAPTRDPRFRSSRGRGSRSSTSPTAASSSGRRRRRTCSRAVAAATREALRFPLAGAAARLARDPGRHRDGRGRAAEPAGPVVRRPIPGRRRSRRRSTSSSGSGSRTSRSSSRAASTAGPRRARSALLVPPEFRRRFRGRLIVHDAESRRARRARDDRRGAPSASRPPSSRPTSSSRVTAAETRARRRPVGARARLLARGAARVGRDLAARDVLVAGLDARGRARAAARRARAASTASRSCSTSRTSSAATRTRSRSSSGSRARSSAAGSACCPAAVRGSDDRAGPARADGGDRARRHALAGAHRGAPAGDRVQGRDARRAARRDRDRDPPDDAVPAPGAPEPRLGGIPRARARAAALAERVPGAAGRHGDPAPRLPAPLPRPGADALPGALHRPAHRPRPRRAPRGRAGRARRTAGRSPSTGRAARSIRSSRSSPGAPATRP